MTVKRTDTKDAMARKCTKVRTPKWVYTTNGRKVKVRVRDERGDRN